MRTSWFFVVLLAIGSVVIGLAAGKLFETPNKTSVTVNNPVAQFGTKHKPRIDRAVSVTLHRGYALSRPRHTVTLTFHSSYINRCIANGTGCRVALLQRINANRAQVGSPPLVLDLRQSRGVTGCVGSSGHSKAMAQTNEIWHISPDPAHQTASFPTDICAGRFASTEGENVGEAGGYHKWDAITLIDNEMMAEPWTPGCQYDHKCNLLYAGYSRIGIGIVEATNGVFITEDFVG